MQLVLSAVQLLLWIFAILVLIRIVMEMVMSFSPEWRPRGVVALLAEAVYTPTDPPLKALRRVIPMVPIGGMRLDLSPMVLLLLISFLSAILAPR